jgi:anaerobic magnesium-protoporphyrin IX monomethyl ester cyclase
VARVFLVNPETDETVRTPLLSFLYLAATLRRAGHEISVLDASAPHAPRDILEEARKASPDLIGIHCKTLYAQDSYRLAKELRQLEIPLVCGGPHPTVAPLEPLAHGFDFSIAGEGEETLTELCDALDGKRSIESIKSLATSKHLGAPRGFLLDLDALADPIDALDLFDPHWYGARETVAPAGLLSSRGCPAACTFCSNNVTGRRFRYRSPRAIAAEIRALKERTGFRAFSFFDDSFAVGRRRIFELCEALAPLDVHWTCTAHPSHLERDVMQAMKAAGCAGVDIGMESADPSMLLRIGKGVTVDRVHRVLQEAKSEGLHCMVNLMFGWPDETLQELQATIDFIREAAPYAAAFNARGVLVPYPGTEIYDQHHARYGFTEWWIREPPLRYSRFPESWAPAEILRAYADDAALERNYFRHSHQHLELMQEGLRLKAELTYRKIAQPIVPGWEPAAPAAGAR